MLQSGEIDLLARDSTWTLTRETELGLQPAFVNLFDQTRILVSRTGSVKSIQDLDGGTICVQPHTTTEFAVADYFKEHKMRFAPLLIPDYHELQAAYLAGRCDGYAAETATLAAFRQSLGAKSDDYRMVSEVLSREPLAVLVRAGDPKWLSVVRWTFFAMVAAEEMNVNSKTIDEDAKSPAVAVRRLLGLEGDLGKALGVDRAWAATVIRSVGNYGEMWERSIGLLGVPRGENNLVRNGGLMYAPSFR
jgi:general L-amino acid transport system substrate-binding protein